MKVNIRPLEINDAYKSVIWRNIPEIWVYTNFSADKEITIEDELSWIKKVIKDETCRRFAIEADDVYIGNIYLTNIRRYTGEYHIFIGDKDYWGKGVAAKASKLIIDYAQDNLDLKTITLAVKSENTAAVMLYNKLGFKYVGIENDFMKMELDLGNYDRNPR